VRSVGRHSRVAAIAATAGALAAAIFVGFLSDDDSSDAKDFSHYRENSAGGFDVALECLN
jgi:hypothetical protein